MNSTSKITFVLTLFLPLASFCQMPDGRWIVPATIIKGDTVPLVHLSTAEVSVIGVPVAKANSIAYYKLRNNIRTCLPYARRAADELQEINRRSETFKNNREKKRFLKAEEAKLRLEFEETLKGLTVSQGRLLILLIDRETGNTTYALVKELKGSLHAVFWQGVAKLWGSNLKTEYDPAGEDKMIEDIIHELADEQEQTRK